MLRFSATHRIYPIQMADLREIDSFAELCETDPSYKGGFN